MIVTPHQFTLRPVTATFFNNRGGAIVAGQQTEIYLTNVIFFQNAGGAVHIEDGCMVKFYQCTFTKNTFEGIIYVQNSTVHIMNTTVEDYKGRIKRRCTLCTVTIPCK